MMTEAKIERVKNSWGRIIAYTEKAGKIFYGKLFEAAPELRSLFHEDTNAQNKKLILAVTVIITKLDKLENLQQETRRLAAMHQNFGLQKRHFDLFIQSFIEMLESISQTLWDKETEEAWTELLYMISASMYEQMNESQYEIVPDQHLS